jgi:lactoylglutathione lyase
MSYCWTTIDVKDMNKSLQFYQEIVGLPVDRKMKPSPDMEIVFLGSGETKVELIWNAKTTAVNIGSDISMGFTVESLDRKIEFLKEKGIAIQSGPFQPNPKTKFLFVLDPDGLRIQFVETIA